MTFCTINLKRGIKHVFLLLDNALCLEDAPFIVLGTVCTGSTTYLLWDFSDGVFAKPPPENPMVWARVIVPCPFLSLPLCAYGQFLPCLYKELPVARRNPSSQHTSFDVPSFHFDNHGPYARFLDSYNIWSCHRFILTWLKNHVQQWLNHICSCSGWISINNHL